MRELFERWENRLTVEGISFAEKYIEGRISIILYVQFGAAEISVKQSVGADARGQGDREVSVLVFGVNINGDNIENNDQAAMLINDVQIVQSVQGIIPSTVGLYRINYQVADFRTRSLYFSTVNRAYEFLSFFKEWKLSTSIRIRDGLADHQIESRMKIVNGVSDNQSRIGWEFKVDLETDISSLAIFLDVQTARVSVSKPLHKGVEVTDVLIGPFDL